LKVYSLSKKERIKNKKDFEMVFSRGKTIFSKSGKLKAVFLQTDWKDVPVKIAVGVSKKAGNAVWRNRIKRLIKDSFRKNKPVTTDKITSKTKTIYIFFATNRLNQKYNKTLTLNDISPDVLNLIKQIEFEINKSVSVT
jgi:ribonuclease P protein component